ncbi:MAG: metal-dependent hydrolase [Actinobacteria bacterium]|nr:metal-dependent hydrolase [Actinomycetota bacterium]
MRRVAFAYPADLDPRWHPRLPELAIAANAVSLLMPHAEPYVVRSVRAVLADLPGELADQAEAYARQEAQHHAQHHRFNALVRRRYPGLARVDGWMRRTFAWLARRRSNRFHLAFAAGFEAVAYAAARWVDGRVTDLFRGADPVPATLLLWHLGEEVEHKSVAHDVHRHLGGSRWGYAGGMLTAAVVLAWFSVLGTLVMLWRDRRIWSPLSHLRLCRWTFSFVFELLPTMAVSALRDHHPADFADPVWLTTWLRQYDPATGTMPEYSLSFLE